MFGFNNKKQKAIDKQINYAIENLYQFWGKDFPIINSDGYDYINRTFKNVAVVYECVNLIYKKVIKSPVVFYKVKNEKTYKEYKQLERKDTPHAKVLKAQSLVEVDEPALQKLLDNPNPQQDYNNFIGVFVLSYLLTGNAYTYKFMSSSTKRPIEIWNFPDLHINSGGVYSPVKDYSQFFNTANQKNYPAETIYHSKTPNPSFDIAGSQLYGVSPLRASLTHLAIIEEAGMQSNRQLKNGGVLNLLSPTRSEDQFNPEQRKSFSEKLREALRSQDPNNRYMTSSISMDVTRVGIPSAELELLGIKSATEEAIYRLFGIPLARYSQKSSTQNNQAESNKQLIYDAIAPMCEVISNMLTKFIGIHFNNTVIELDYTQLPEMAVNMKEMSEYIIPLVKVGILQRDEARFAFKYSETGLDYMKDFWYDDKPMSKIYSGELQPGNSNNNNNGAT